VWGGLTAATVAPRQWLVYDQSNSMVYGYLAAGERVRALPAVTFFAEYNSVLVQATLLLLGLAGLAGWATWQLTRIRPRGEAQAPLRSGSDWYLIALALGGLAGVLAFQRLGLAAAMKGSPNSPLATAVAVVEVMLPLYMGIVLFLVWFRRLPAARPPDWETRYPRPARRPGARRWRWFARKGGEPPSA
jgi:hypothetical protein